MLQVAMLAKKLTAGEAAGLDKELALEQAFSGSPEPTSLNPKNYKLWNAARRQRINRLITKHPLELKTSSLAPRRLEVVLDVDSQHTLSWTHSVGPTAKGLAPGGPLANLGVDRDDELPAGSCNLYHSLR